MTINIYKIHFFRDHRTVHCTQTCSMCIQQCIPQHPNWDDNRDSQQLSDQGTLGNGDVCDWLWGLVSIDGRFWCDLGDILRLVLHTYDRRTSSLLLHCRRHCCVVHEASPFLREFLDKALVAEAVDEEMRWSVDCRRQCRHIDEVKVGVATSTCTGWYKYNKNAANWIQDLEYHEHQYHSHQWFGHVVLRLCFLGHELTTSDNTKMTSIQWLKMFVTLVWTISFALTD